MQEIKGLWVTYYTQIVMIILCQNNSYKTPLNKIKSKYI